MVQVADIIWDRYSAPFLYHIFSCACTFANTLRCDKDSTIYYRRPFPPSDCYENGLSRGVWLGYGRIPQCMKPDHLTRHVPSAEWREMLDFQ